MSMMKRANVGGTFGCVVILGLSVAGLSAHAANTWIGPANGDWFEASNWSENVPTNGASVAVGTGASIMLTNASAVMAAFNLDAGALLTFQGWESPLTATEMTISGTLTHLDHLGVTETNTLGGWDTLHRIYLQGSNITVASDAMLNADFLGYPTMCGPGGSLSSRDGAGHAGNGGCGYLEPGGGGGAYGDPVSPSQPGSGGGGSMAGLEGGGVIRIAADGHLELSGTLSVDGRSWTTTHDSGGSGGSIWLSCRTFGGTATGLVRAHGGAGRAQGAGGAAGRLALHYNPEAQAALTEPVPPVCFSGVPGAKGGSVNTRYPAAMGSLYLPDTLFMTEFLSNQLFWHIRPIIPGFNTWEPNALTLDNCVLGLPEGFQLAVTNDMVLTNGAALHLFAAPVNDPLSENGGLISVGGDLRLVDNAWIFPYACDTNGASVLFDVASNLVVAAGCGFDADDLGFRWLTGPGIEEMRFSELGSGLYLSGGCGAGHGGGGGAGWNCTGCRGYGEAASPRLPGSGSRSKYSGRGGGVIRIAVGERARIDGLLSAGASEADKHSAVGSGSGGSILLTCLALEGGETGLIRVPGGLSRPSSGGGGGGRIAVLYDSVGQAESGAPSIGFSAAEGARYSTSPQRGAEMGSLYFPDTQLVQALVEGGQFQKVRIEIPGFMHWEPASLTLDGGEFMLPAGFLLDVAGDLTLSTGACLHLQAAPTNAPGTVGARLTVGGNLAIAAGGWIYPYAEWTNGAVVGIRVTGNVTIDEGGGIDADGRGYTPMGNNLNGLGAGQNSSSGGGYGGHGGGTGGGVTYGRADLPLAPGSPAGWYLRDGGLRAGQGGGAIRLLAGGTIHLDGVLSADAMEQEPNYNGAGASGGAIFLAARRLTGNGVMRASGTLNYSRAKADGGGGRIAVWVGLPLATVEGRIAAADTRGLAPKMSWKPFTGSLEALRASDEAEDGTADIYAVNSTLFLIR